MTRETPESGIAIVGAVLLLMSVIVIACLHWPTPRAEAAAPPDEERSQGMQVDPEAWDEPQCGDGCGPFPS